MHRRSLLALLAQYQAAWPEEALTVQRIRALIDGHATCFQRDCRPGHITGSAWVMSADGQRHLLLHHRKLDKWLQPGGHADGQFDIPAVALREAIEESGLTKLRLAETPKAAIFDLDVHEIPARQDNAGRVIEDAHEHHDIRFLVIAEGDEPIVVSDESHSVRWFTADQVRERTAERSVLRLLEKAERHSEIDFVNAKQ